MVSDSKKSTMATARIPFNYFKQGDDLSFHIKDGVPPAEVFRSHKLQMESVVAHSEAIATELDSLVDQSQIKIEGGTHYCGISGPRSFIDHLVSLGLVEYDEEDEEDFEEEYDEDEDDSEEELV